MIYILGSGNFTNFLTKKLNKKKFVVITSSQKSNENIINVGNNLKKISQLKIDDDRSYCIINWSHTFIRKFDDFKYSIDALALSATNGGKEVVKIKPLAVDLITSQT